MKHIVDYEERQVKMVGSTKEIAKLVITLDQVVTNGTNHHPLLSYHIKLLKGNKELVILEFDERQRICFNCESAFYVCNPKYDHDGTFVNTIVPNFTEVIEKMYKNRTSP